MWISRGKCECPLTGTRDLKEVDSTGLTMMENRRAASSFEGTAASPLHSFCPLECKIYMNLLGLMLTNKKKCILSWQRKKGRKEGRKKEDKERKKKRKERKRRKEIKKRKEEEKNHKNLCVGLEYHRAYLWLLPEILLLWIQETENCNFVTPRNLNVTTVF